MMRFLVYIKPIFIYVKPIIKSANYMLQALNNFDQSHQLFMEIKQNELMD